MLPVVVLAAPSPLMYVIGGAVVLIAAVWGGLYWWVLRGERVVDAPDSAAATLWSCLCAVHGLSPVDAQRLSALGDASSRHEPVMVFLDPQILEHAAAAGGEADAREYERLGRWLFRELYRAA